MDYRVLEDMRFKVDREELYKKLHIRKKNQYTERIEELIQEAEQIAKPKSLYRVAYIEEKGEDFIIVEGIKFTSKILRVNLGDTHRIFPFLATGGKEIEDWANNIDDVFDTYIVDAIQEMAYKAACENVFKHIDDHYKLKNPSKMNPGSLGDWPLKEQKNLFKLLEDKPRLIGIELNSSFLMRPVKSVSGIRFSGEIHFENCQLCPKDCKNRQASYDKSLYESRYGIKESYSHTEQGKRGR